MPSALSGNFILISLAFVTATCLGHEICHGKGDYNEWLGCDSTTRSCPDNTNGTIMYSPFKPYWWPKPTGTPQECWWWASCVYLVADQARIQQFNATSLVMGLIPLTLRDIAWPNRRVILLSNPLYQPIEIIVRALGLEPSYVDGSDEDALDKVQTWRKTSNIARATANHLLPCICLCTLWLLISLSAAALTETYSKRSALGCIVPIFIPLWYLVALFPAWLHALCSRLRKNDHARDFALLTADGGRDERATLQHMQEQAKQQVSAVPGGDQWWIVQLVWAIYYIAGTLIYTSIMAVTVIELFVWVLVSVNVGAGSKYLAFFVCLWCDRGVGGGGSGNKPLVGATTPRAEVLGDEPANTVGWVSRVGVKPKAP